MVFLSPVPSSASRLGKRNLLRGCLAWLSVVPFSGCSVSDNALVLHTLRGTTMGTTFTIKVATPEKRPPDYGKVEDAVQTLLRGINEKMSTFDDASEISRFNRFQESDWFPVSADLATVLSESLRISRLSGGAFDVTVGGLVTRWGFGPEGRKDTLPDEEVIAEMLDSTGFQHLSVRTSPPGVKKDRPSVVCDLSAIAKGFGVDRLAEYLDSAGFGNFMVEIGGETRVQGTNDQRERWRIGVRKPDGSAGIQRVLAITGQGMATSGDYANTFERDGVRYTHTLDPRTGRPVTSTLASVTVVHPSCMTADALATSIHVLGPDAGLEFALEHGLAVLLILRDGETFVERWTAEAEAFFAH